MKLIDLYYQWMEKGRIPRDGLCNSIPSKYDLILDLFKPDELERLDMRLNGLSDAFWASGLSDRESYYLLSTPFTPLRQTIVLFICAIHGEI
jgi:hypothetical protein